MIESVHYTLLGQPATPYVYQEFPRMLHGIGGTTLIVANVLEKEAALDAGWQLVPYLDETPVPSPAAPVMVDLLAAPAPFTAADSRDVQYVPVDPAVLSGALPTQTVGSRRPGRPRKVEATA